MRYVVSIGLAISFSMGTLVMAEPQNCGSVQFSKKNPIYCAIMSIHPKVEHSWAMILSNYIHKYSRKYTTDPLRTVAIIAQESMFRNVHRKHTVLELVEECDEAGECIEYLRKVRGYTDIGLYQFHAATIEAYGMDALRLRDDIEYATERHCFLLSVKLRECADLGDSAWTCYHSRTPLYREKYERMVNRYYERITNND